MIINSVQIWSEVGSVEGQLGVEKKDISENNIQGKGMSEFHFFFNAFYIISYFPYFSPSFRAQWYRAIKE